MSKRMVALTGVATFWSAGLASADVTALQVWEEWQAIQAALGSATMSAASQSYVGGTLTLNGVETMSAEDGVVMRGAIEQVVMQERGDGTVRITASPLYTLAITDAVEDVQTGFEVRMEGLELIAGGDDLRTYAITAGALSIANTAITIEGEQVPFETQATLRNVTAKYEINMRLEAMPYDVDMQASVTEISVAGSDDTGTDGLRGSFQYNDVTYDFGGEIAAGGPEFPNFGASIIGDFAFATSSLRAEVTVDGRTGVLEGISGGGTSDFTSTPEQVAVSSTSRDTGLRVMMPGFPFPLESVVGTMSYGLKLPVSAQDTPQEMGLSLALREVVLSDFIWGLFDGTGQIPREPATLAVDLEGTALVFANLFGAAEEFDLLDGPPGELETAAIRELAVEFGGASLMGTGAVEFETVDGVPDPVGAVDLVLEGGFALLDALVAAGIIPQGQAAGLRAMSGAFATPVGEDTLTSNIQFSAGGGISVNGFPIQ